MDLDVDLSFVRCNKDVKYGDTASSQGMEASLPSGIAADFESLTSNSANGSTADIVHVGFCESAFPLDQVHSNVQWIYVALKLTFVKYKYCYGYDILSINNNHI